MNVNSYYKTTVVILVQEYSNKEKEQARVPKANQLSYVWAPDL